MYMEIHVHVYSILAKKEQEEEKENQPPHTQHKQTNTSNRPTHIYTHKKNRTNLSMENLLVTTHSGANIPECGVTTSTCTCPDKLCVFPADAS